MPTLYWAQIGLGAYRVTSPSREQTQLRVDSTARRGIVLFTDRGDPAYIQRLTDLGFTLEPTGGAVMKALCVADPDLFHRAYPGLRPTHERVVGAISTMTYAHDNVGVGAIVRAAGGFACSPDGSDIKLTYGQKGSIFANSQKVLGLLQQAMN